MSENKDPEPGRQSTPDGRRVQLRVLLQDVIPAKDGRQTLQRGRLRRLLHNLNFFLAGMYTGEGCAGTPHSESRRRQPEGEDNKDE
jgi:hypothetical protein